MECFNCTSIKARFYVCGTLRVQLSTCCQPSRVDMHARLLYAFYFDPPSCRGKLPRLPLTSLEENESAKRPFHLSFATRHVCVRVSHCNGVYVIILSLLTSQLVEHTLTLTHISRIGCLNTASSPACRCSRGCPISRRGEGWRWRWWGRVVGCGVRDGKSPVCVRRGHQTRNY